MQVNLDLSGVQLQRESTTDFVPAGDYTVKCVSVDAAEAKSKSGHYFKLIFEVTSGEHTGKRLMDIFNVMHSNPDTQRIAQSTLKTFMTYGGHANPEVLRDTSELVTLTALIKVIAEKQTSDKGVEYDTNQIKAYKKQDGGVAAPVVAAPVAVAPVAPVAVTPVAVAPVVAPPVVAPAIVVAPAVVATSVVAAAPAAGAFPWGQPQ